MFLGCRDGFQHLSCRQSWTGCCEVAQTVHEDALLLLGGDKAYIGTSGDIFHVGQVSRSVQFRLSWSYSPNRFGLRKTWVGDHPYHFEASFTRLWKVAFQNSLALSCLIHSSSNVLVVADFWGRSANQKALVLESWVLNRMSWCCCGAQQLAGQGLLIDPEVFVSFGANLSWVFFDILIDLYSGSLWFLFTLFRHFLGGFNQTFHLVRSLVHRKSLVISTTRDPRCVLRHPRSRGARAQQGLAGQPGRCQRARPGGDRPGGEWLVNLV